MNGLGPSMEIEHRRYISEARDLGVEYTNQPGYHKYQTTTPYHGIDGYSYSTGQNGYQYR